MFSDLANFPLSQREGEITVTYAPVPEPTTALLLGCGLAALAARRKR